MARRNKDNGEFVFAILIGTVLALIGLIKGLWEQHKQSKAENSSYINSLSFKSYLANPSGIHLQKWVYRLSVPINVILLGSIGFAYFSQYYWWELIFTASALLLISLMCVEQSCRALAFPIGDALVYLFNIKWRRYEDEVYNRQAPVILAPVMEQLNQFVEASIKLYGDYPLPILKAISVIEDERTETFYKLLQKSNFTLPFPIFKSFLKEQLISNTVAEFKKCFLQKHPNIKSNSKLQDYITTYLKDFQYNENYDVDFSLMITNTESLMKSFSDINQVRLQIDEMRHKNNEEQKIEKLKTQLKNGSFDRNITINDIDLMEGHEFEDFLEALFTDLGYKVTPTRQTSDQGVDLLIEKNGEIIAVQAKRYSKDVGNEAVQQIVSGKHHYKCDKAMVVTNQNFTRQAKQLADTNNVILWGRDKIIDAITSRPQKERAA